MSLLVILVPLATAAAAPLLMVEQHGKAFLPGAVVLTRGQTVNFTNTDPFAHQLYIESDAMNYDSGIQAPGDTRALTFDKAGTFTVLCAIHPRMQLDVTVR